MARGNGRMRIFLDEGDYRKFLYILGDVVDLFSIDCWDLCLMPNHYHLALYPRKPNLSVAIAYLNSVYAMWWNATHSTVGHVFQGRFKAQVVQRDGYLLALCRYIALNPVRARLVERPEQWLWSSYRATAGLSPSPGFLFSDPVLNEFGETDVALSRQRYVQHVLTALPDEDEMTRRLRSRDRVVGNRAFKLRLLGDRVRSGLDAELATGDTAESRRHEVPTPLT